MTSRLRVTMGIVVLLMGGTVLAESGSAADSGPAGVEFFETKIRPLLADHCYKCHSADANAAGKLKGDLFLDSRAGVLKGGEKGAVVVPGKPEESLLIQAVRYQNKDLQMPPKDRLSAELVSNLEKWIAMGAPDPRAGQVPVIVKKGIDIEQGRKFWAFQPLSHVSPPSVKNEQWVRTDVDRFVLREQEVNCPLAQCPHDSPEAHPPSLFRPDRPPAIARRSC